MITRVSAAPVGKGRLTTGALVVVPVTVLVVLDAWRWRWFVHPDLRIARQAADVLLSSRWTDLYAAAPNAQMGPGAIALALLPHGLYNVVVAATVLPFQLTAAAPLLRPGTAAWRRWSWGIVSLALVAPWGQLAWKGHADDALVLTGMGVVVLGVREDRPRWVLSGWVLAIVGKPTALAMAPLLLAFPSVALVCAVVTAAVWCPFVAADPMAMLRAGQGVMPVVPGDGLAYLGVPVGRPPGWVRPVQLLLAWGGALLGLLRRRPEVGLLVGLTLRTVLEPNPAPAYSITLVAVAVMVDARRLADADHLRGALPVATALATASFWTSQLVLSGGSGIPRLLSLLALVAWSAWVLSGRALRYLGMALAAVRDRVLRGAAVLTASGTWVGLMAVPMHGPPAVLQRGSLGDGVRCVQWAATRMVHDSPGQEVPQVPVDGVFGDSTMTVVWILQAESAPRHDGRPTSLDPVDGRVGPRTGTLLHLGGFTGAPAAWRCGQQVPWDPRLVSEAQADLARLSGYVDDDCLDRARQLDELPGDLHTLATENSREVRLCAEAWSTHGRDPRTSRLRAVVGHAPIGRERRHAPPSAGTRTA